LCPVSKGGGKTPESGKLFEMVESVIYYKSTYFNKRNLIFDLQKLQKYKNTKIQNYKNTKSEYLLNNITKYN
jgi:hypothetical protein